MDVDRYVGLARISMEERRKARKGVTGHSISTQVDIIYSVGKSLGMNLAVDLGCGFHIKATGGERAETQYPGIYYDDGGPGWAMGRKLRPALYQLIEDAKAHKFEVVIVAYQDRLSRLSDATKKLYRAFKAVGVKMVVDGRVIGDQDIMVLGIKAETFEDIIRNIRQKTKDTLSRLKAEGVKLGPPPIGLQRTEDGKAFEPSSFGRRIKELHDANFSVEEIRRTAGMYAPKQGESRLLSKSGIYRVLRNLDWLEKGTFEDNMSKLREPVLRKLQEYDAMLEQDRREFDQMLDSIPGVRYEFD